MVCDTHCSNGSTGVTQWIITPRPRKLCSKSRKTTPGPTYKHKWFNSYHQGVNKVMYAAFYSVRLNKIDKFTSIITQFRFCLSCLQYFPLSNIQRLFNFKWRSKRSLEFSHIPSGLFALLWWPSSFFSDNTWRKMLHNWPWGKMMALRLGLLHIHEGKKTKNKLATLHYRALYDNIS